jgi:hypothetical protein
MMLFAALMRSIQVTVNCVPCTQSTRLAFARCRPDRKAIKAIVGQSTILSALSPQLVVEGHQLPGELKSRPSPPTRERPLPTPHHQSSRSL